jgi:hypothetical protein
MLGRNLGCRNSRLSGQTFQIVKKAAEAKVDTELFRKTVHNQQSALFLFAVRIGLL